MLKNADQGTYSTHQDDCQSYLGCARNLLTTIHYESLIQHQNLLHNFFFCGKQVRRNTSLMYRETIVNVLVFFTLFYCLLLYKIITVLITIMRPPQSKSRPSLNAPGDQKPSINTFKPNKGGNCLASLEFEPGLCR